MLSFRFFCFLLLIPKEAMVDADQRPRPHSNLIRQSSWSGLSESSSHESLTGPLVKSNSLNSMKTSSDSKRTFLFLTGTF